MTKILPILMALILCGCGESLESSSKDPFTKANMDVKIYDMMLYRYKGISGEYAFAYEIRMLTKELSEIKEIFKSQANKKGHSR
jgi:hypothetical protein